MDLLFALDCAAAVIQLLLLIAFGSGLSRCLDSKHACIAITPLQG